MKYSTQCLCIVISCEFLALIFANKPIMKMSKVLDLHYDNVTLRGEYIFKIRVNKSGVADDDYDDDYNYDDYDNDNDGYYDDKSKKEKNNVPDRIRIIPRVNYIGENGSKTERPQSASENFECVFIASYITKKKLAIDKVDKKVKTHVRADNSLELNSWDIIYVDKEIYTIRVPHLPYYWGLQNDCNAANAMDRIQIYSTEAFSRNLFFTLKAKENDPNLFTISVCDRCLFVDKNDILQVGNSKNCTEKDYLFTLEDNANKVCSVLRNVYIRNKNTYISSTESNSILKAVSFKNDNISRWDIVNYRNYTMIILSKNSSFYWYVPKCHQNSIVSISNEKKPKNDKFWMTATYLHNTWLVAKAVFYICERFVVLNIGQETTSSLANDLQYADYITSNNGQENNFIFTYSIVDDYNDTAPKVNLPISEMETVSCIYIVSKQNKNKVGVKQIRKNDSYIMAKESFKTNKWDIQFLGNGVGYTIGVPWLPYYWGLHADCETAYFSQRISLYSKQKIFFNAKIISDDFTIFTLSVCDRCIIADEEGFLKIGEFKDCTKSNSMFYLEYPEPNSVCSSLNKIYIQTNSSYVTVNKPKQNDLSLIALTDFPAENIPQWDIINYETYTRVKLSQKSLYWHVFDCNQTVPVSVINDSQLTRQGLLMEAKFASEEWIIAKASFSVCDKKYQISNLDPIGKTLVTTKDVSAKDGYFYFTSSLKGLPNLLQEGNKSKKVTTKVDQKHVDWNITECVEIVSKTTKRKLQIKHLSKKSKVFAVSDTSFELSKWNIQYVDQFEKYTFSVSYLPYYLGVDGDCVKPVYKNPLIIYTSDFTKNKLYFKIHFMDKNQKIFTLSVCGRCVFIDNDNIWKISYSKECTGKDHLFYIVKPKQNELCTVVREIYIRTSNDYYTSITKLKNYEHVKVKGDVNEYAKWDMFYYLNYTIIKLFAENSYQWYCDVDDYVRISTDGQQHLARFSITTMPAFQNWIIAKAVIKCEKLFVTNVNSTILVANTSSSSKGFYLSYTINDIICTRTVKAYIKFLNEGSYVGLGNPYKTAFYKRVELTAKRLWTIDICPYYKLISVSNITHRFYWFDNHKGNNGEVILMKQGTKWELDLDTPGVINSLENRTVFCFKSVLRTQTNPGAEYYRNHKFKLEITGT